MVSQHAAHKTEGTMCQLGEKKRTDKATGRKLTTDIAFKYRQQGLHGRKLYFVGQFVTLHKCSLRFMGHNVYYTEEKAEHYPPLQHHGPLHDPQAKWAMFSTAVAGQRGLPLHAVPPQLAPSITCQSA